MVDITTHRASPITEHSSSEDHLELVEESESSERIKQIVVASVLASLSIAIAPSASMIARVAGWGIALFDPVSLFWIAAFLIGGYRVGIISMSAGTLGLFLYDPTAIGPIFKFAATLPMILIPLYGVMKLRSEVGGEALSKPKFYTSMMGLAFIVRLAIMLPFNFLYWSLLMPIDGAAFVYILLVVQSINSVQSLGDAIVPYLIIHPTGIFKHFGMW
ncbi:MAG: hypothetical protein E4H14_09460 [Candidatus Thorarchaeota archaeon]|nr:MAG: hypothetical protein E4H14_09460 [Candidatus Thorarchaeota archaeon]